MVKIKDLAPLLIAAGVEPGAIRKKCRPNNPRVAVDPVIPPKRYREVMVLLAEHPELSNKQIADRVAGFTKASEIAPLRAEVEAVKAALAADPPVDPDAPPDPEPEDLPLNPLQIKPSTERVAPADDTTDTRVR
jgi:hypothetical protein